MSRINLVTVSSDDFVPGTIAMFSSFSRHHRDLQTDFTVIHDDLSEASIRELRRHFPYVEFREAGRDLQSKLDELCCEIPAISKRRSRFLSVEVMAITGYDKVLFCDSDIVFRMPISALFDLSVPLAACGDLASLNGEGRDGITFSLEVTTGRPRLPQPFNAGLMVFDGAVCHSDNRQALLDLISPIRWRAIRTGHTDQILYNLHFNGRQHILGPTYNYLLGHRGEIQKISSVRPQDARVLHYNGPEKPWQTPSMRGDEGSGGHMFDAHAVWHEVYAQALEALGPQD